MPRVWTAIRKWMAVAIIINPVFQWKLLFTPFPSLVIEKINTAQYNLEHLLSAKEDVDLVITFPRPTACHSLIRWLRAHPLGFEEISSLLASHPKTYISSEESDWKGSIRRRMGHNRSYVNSAWMSQTNTRDALRQTATPWTPAVQEGLCTCSQWLFRKTDSSHCMGLLEWYEIHDGVTAVRFESIKSLKRQTEVFGNTVHLENVSLNIRLQPAAGSLA